MKILIINNIFPPGFIGGYELGAYDVATALSQKGHQISVLTSDYFLDQQHSITHFPVIRTLESTFPAKIQPYDADEILGKGFFINTRNIRLLSDFLIKEQPDAIVCFNLYGLGVLGILKYLISLHYTPILYLMDNSFYYLTELHAHAKSYLSTFGQTDFLHKTKNIFMSQCLLNEVENRIGFKLNNSEFIPGWYKQDNISDFKFRYTIADNKTRFIFSSRLTESKGIYKILAAVKKITDLGYKNFLVDIYGAGEVTTIIHKIAALSLREFIHYQGCLDKQEMCQKFAEYDALLFPTRSNEAFGFVVTEAAATGCLPIMTHSIGAAEWFLHDNDCIKISPTEDELAAVMMRFIDLSVESKNELRMNALHTAQQYLNFDHWINKIESIITETVTTQDKEIKSAAEKATAMLALDDIWRRKIYGTL